MLDLDWEGRVCSFNTLSVFCVGVRGGLLTPGEALVSEGNSDDCKRLSSVVLALVAGSAEVI